MTELVLARPPAMIARATIAQHSRSFALASRLLAPRVRDQTAVVYTWCRRVDDAIDELGSAKRGSAAEWQRGVIDELGSAKRGSAAEWQRGVIDELGDASGALARLRSELADVYSSDASRDARIGCGGLGKEPKESSRTSSTVSDPVLAAFADVVHARAIPQRYPEALLDGMAMDVAGARYATIDDVIAYAWRVAGVVGLMMAHVFGVSDDAALVPAAQLGIAMQLTNICRDVAEDWALGRLYLPDELLARHGAGGLAVELGRPLPRAAHAAIARTRRDLLALADRYYRAGDRGIPALPWRAALAVAAARRVYAAIGDRIARANYEITAGRAVVPASTKLALVARGAAQVVAGRRRMSLPRVPQRTLELADVAAP